MISLISNTGIQFYKTHIQFDWSEFRTKFHFHQYWNKAAKKLSLEVAQQFSDQVTGDAVYVSKNDLKTNDLLDINDKYVGTWNNDADIRRFSEEHIIEIKASTLQKPILKGEQPVLAKFFNQWLPIPCFEKNVAGRLQEGPYNWARIMVSPKGFDANKPNEYDYSDSQDWNITIAFDTTSVFDDGNYSNEFREAPLFANRFDRKKIFSMPITDLMLMNFVAPPKGNSDWIDAGILKLVHNTSDINMLYHMFPKDEDNPTAMPPVYTYLASYLYFLHIIADRLSRIEIELLNAEQVAPINVDLVVDMGNSKTTAVLFEEGRFDKVDMVELQDFSHPLQSEKSPFDMNVVFNRASFGICKIGNSRQFTYPSLVRLGREATYLRYQAGLEKMQKYSTCSSPKRYLWDKHPSPYEWQNIRHGNDDPEPISLNGITNQFNSDGTINTMGMSGGEIRYSRRSLMTFAFLEILAQSYRQINSQKFREDKGEVDIPRRISKILVTCPTAMSRVEQIELRTAAAEAYTVLNRYYSNTDTTQLDYHVAMNSAPVKPSLRDLRTRDEENRKWLYDEATCVQFVYLCAEVVTRYKNNCAEFFERYGKLRSDILEADRKTPYTKKALTIGSVDIGAGTTDVMICTYKYATVGQTTLTPVPRYWESFYTAGDDILKAFVQNIVVEGKNSMVENKLISLGKEQHVITTLITDFFGENTARMSFSDRQIRREFCQQISVPIAQCFMECTRLKIAKRELDWNDIYYGQDKPNQDLLDAFYQHFGFRIEDQMWHYDINITTQIINSVMDSLLKKISVALAEYGCDIVLLAGRPCSLKPIEDIFLKYYPVEPNRLKVLNDYRVGRWYPFQDGNGFFENQKSVVAVGALVGYICSELGGYKGMSFNLGELGQKILPTTNYIGLMSNAASTLISNKDVLLDPKKNTAVFTVPSIPIRLGCRQLDTESYPARSLFTLDFDDDAIREIVKNELKQKGLSTDNNALIQDAVDTRKMRIRQNMPVKLEIERDYLTDREGVIVTDVADRNDNNVPKKYLSLQIRSLSESDTFWLDNGEFKCKISSKG